MHRNSSLAVSLVLLAAGHGAAQSVNYAVSPAGCEGQAGNSNNTYPFYAVSTRYQQIHDAVDLGAYGSSLLINGMDFRPSATFTIPARSWEVELTLGTTSVPASQMLNTFTANFTASPTVVLPFTTINQPSGAGTGGSPNQVVWRFPFKTPYPYIVPLGNLCWEWRSRNGVSIQSSPMDAVSGTASLGAVHVLPNHGTSCTATGQSSPAVGTLALSGSNIGASLAGARASAVAYLAIGVDRLVLPFGCGTLYTNPLILVGGTTDSSGNWNAGSGPASSLSITPYAEVRAQFAWDDPRLPLGLGLTSLMRAGAPGNGGKYVSRMYAAMSSTNGGENAATGTVGRNYGVVVHFVTL